MDKYKQVIIARKDLGMSPGKLAAQVSHASNAFLLNKIKTSALAYKDEHSLALLPEDVKTLYKSFIYLDVDLYEKWICGEYAKSILQAKNKFQLMKATCIAEESGLKENEDFFVIRDNCHTELKPEESDGTTITCIGFKPMYSSVIDVIGKKYQLWS